MLFQPHYQLPSSGLNTAPAWAGLTFGHASESWEGQGGREAGKAQGSAFLKNPLVILMHSRAEKHFTSQWVAFQLPGGFLLFPLPHLGSLLPLSFQCLPHLVGPTLQTQLEGAYASVKFSPCLDLSTHCAREN